MKIYPQVALLGKMMATGTAMKRFLGGSAAFSGPVHWMRIWPGAMRSPFLTGEGEARRCSV